MAKCSLLKRITSNFIPDTNELLKNNTVTAFYSPNLSDQFFHFKQGADQQQSTYNQLRMKVTLRSSILIDHSLSFKCLQNMSGPCWQLTKNIMHKNMAWVSRYTNVWQTKSKSPLLAAKIYPDSILILWVITKRHFKCSSSSLFLYLQFTQV